MPRTQTVVYEIDTTARPSLTYNQDGTYTFNPGDDDVEVLPSLHLTGAAFNSGTNVLTLTMSDDSTIQVTLA